MKFTGYQIRILRMAKQIKQVAIANKMGISPQRYSQLENQPDPTPKRINEMLEIIGFTKESAENFLRLLPPLLSNSFLTGRKIPRPRS